MSKSTPNPDNNFKTEPEPFFLERVDSKTGMGGIKYFNLGNQEISSKLKATLAEK